MNKATFLKALGQNIIQLRTLKGWSQSDLARVCEKDRQSIERLENGKINPSIFYLLEVAYALDLPLSALLDFQYSFEPLDL